MAWPLASVIIPAFNAERFLAKAVDSALGQTYPNVEVVVVDDGSSDGTRDMLEGYARRDGRVRFFTQENGGVGAARNRAIAEARGEFIAPLDADDFWYPEKLEKQVRVLSERREEWGMSYCWSKSVNEKGEATEPLMHWPMEGDIFEALIYRNIIGNASVPLFRASALRKVGGYRTRAEQHGAQGCEDWDLTVRVAKDYMVAAVPEYLCAYRQVAGTMSSNYAGMAQSYWYTIGHLKKICPELPSRLMRWSAGHFHLYLINICYGSGNYRQCFGLIARLLSIDPTMVLCPTIYRVFIVGLLRLVLGREVFKREHVQTKSFDPDKFLWMPAHRLEARRWAEINRAKGA